MSPRLFSTTLKPVLSFPRFFSRTAATLLLQFLFGNTLLDVVNGVLVNATIDDHYGDSLTSALPEFLPRVAGIWEGEECGGCRVKPDRDRAFRGTYNAATYRPEAGINPVSIQMRFTGIAIYVFLTLANDSGEGITTKTQANFTVDNEAPVLFSHEPNMSTKEFIYQYPAFTRTGLEHKDHTLSVVMSGPQEHLFLNFDYATYTYDNTLYSGAAVTVTSTSSPSSQPTSTAANSNDKNKTSLAGPVAGGVAGGVAIFALFVLALFFIRRRKSRRSVGPEYHSPDTVQSTGQSRHRQYPSLPTTPIPPYAHQTPSQSTQSLGRTVVIGGSTNTSGRGSRRPRNAPHIQPFTQLRSAADRKGRGHIPQQPSLSQTQLSYGDSNRAPTPTLSNLSSGLEYTSASSSSGQRAPVGQPASTLPTHNASDGDLEQRVQALQQSINSMIATIQVEQDTLSSRGLSEEQINTSLETMRRNLAALADQMAGLQARRRTRETWATSHDGRQGGEDLPEYESPTLPSRTLPEP